MPTNTTAPNELGQKYWSRHEEKRQNFGLKRKLIYYVSIGICLPPKLDKMHQNLDIWGV